MLNRTTQARLAAAVLLAGVIWPQIAVALDRDTRSLETVAMAELEKAKLPLGDAAGIFHERLSDAEKEVACNSKWRPLAEQNVRSFMGTVIEVAREYKAENVSKEVLAEAEHRRCAIWPWCWWK